MIIPRRPNEIETATTQNRNSGNECIEVTPKAMPISRIPIAVTVVRATTTVSEPMIIST